MRAAENFLSKPATRWLVGALALVLFLTTNLPWQLDDYDQAKQAFTSFEMVKEGDWLYQRTPHERIATKPPLVGWISAGVFEITRSWDVAWRLPSIAAAIALSILLFRAGNIYGAAGGLIALSAFAFNLLTPRLASLVRTDMPLALVVFLIGAQIWKKIRDGTRWERRDRLSIFALLTAAMLIKGPIVYAFLLPGIVAFQWWRRKTKASSSAWCGWWPWLASLSIFLAWVIGGSILVPQFYDQVVLREFVGRFGETVHRPQPIYFYLPHLLHKFAPWSVLLIGWGIVDLRGREWKIREVIRNISPEIFWLICWGLGGLLVMSLIPSKRVDRVFPVIPPLCLLLATHLRPRWNRWVAAALLLSILSAGGYSAFKVWSGYHHHRHALVVLGHMFRDQLVRNHWRYEVAESSDESLLLYFDKLHFINPTEAIDKWKRGELDALVVPDDADWWQPLQTPGTTYWIMPAEARRARGPNYRVLVR
jgi:4-amino-4-deoxy-L-arabinose transferase-like glycosyltransferase